MGRTPTVVRQAVRIAVGKKPRGGKPKTDVAAHEAEIGHLTRTVAELHAWSSMLRDGLAVVVLDRTGIQDEPCRQVELQTAVELLAELQATAPSGVQAELTRLHTHVRLAAPALLTFVVPLDAVHADMQAVVGRVGPGADRLGLAAA